MTKDSPDELLRAPDNDESHNVLNRLSSTYNPQTRFNLPKGEHRHYTQQYADMYFARLAQLKPAVEAAAAADWDDTSIGDEVIEKVDRVLDVRQGVLCWIVGTVFMDMPLKPCILDDISREHWIAAPPPREKFTSADGQDQVMLEDESGRLRLTGPFIKEQSVVTGCVIAVLGTENKDGDFEVLDVREPNLPRQPTRWERDDGDAAVAGKQVMQKRPKAGKIAIVSGLSIGAEQGDTISIDLLTEYLLGEATSSHEQDEVANISRLIIVGNSLASANPIPSREEMAQKKSGVKKYGYDSSAYNAGPTDRLDELLTELLASIPITIIPGESDPTHTALPQAPIHAALLPRSRAYMAAPNSNEVGWLDSATNPWQGDIDGWRVLATGGQPVDDMFKYVDGESRLDMMESMMRWRLVAPTAPDTLWCYPFQDGDAFVVDDCPHMFLVGNQPRFETTTIKGALDQVVRLIAVPKFRETGEMVLLDAETLIPEIVRFSVGK